jgi:hypothetical protein
MEEDIEERNAAIASMDKDRIIKYCKAHDVTIPEDETVFWAGVHKVATILYILEDDVITDEQYDKSFEWLKAHGYKPYFRMEG